MATRQSESSFFHLTQYSENAVYVQAQLESLASEMGIECAIPDSVKVGDSIKLKNNIATFVFVCTELDSLPNCSANYYKLAIIQKHLPIEVGATVIMDCHFQNAYKQGEKGVITKNEGASGWWAKFPTGTWNVGAGHDFFVIQSA